jgi:hypothetical protein
MAGWLVASNHCALGNFIPATPEAPNAHEHCAGEKPSPASESESTGCDGSKCCKALNAPQALAKSPLQLDPSYVQVQLASALVAAPSAQHDAPISELDTGPPGRISFAESVLQRSLLAHAPPVLA